MPQAVTDCWLISRLRIFTYTSRYTFFVTHFIRLLCTSVTQNLLRILYVGRYAFTLLRILYQTAARHAPTALKKVAVGTHCGYESSGTSNPGGYTKTYMATGLYRVVQGPQV